MRYRDAAPVGQTFDRGPCLALADEASLQRELLVDTRIGSLVRSQRQSDHLRQRHPGFDLLGRQAKDLQETPIVDDELLLGVEHAQALRHVREGGVEPFVLQGQVRAGSPAAPPVVRSSTRRGKVRSAKYMPNPSRALSRATSPAPYRLVAEARRQFDVTAPGSGNDDRGASGHDRVRRWRTLFEHQLVARGEQPDLQVSVLDPRQRDLVRQARLLVLP